METSTTSQGLFIAFAGLGNYGDTMVQQSGMGQLAQSPVFSDHHITSMAFGHHQVDEAYQAASDYHTEYPDAPIAIAGHSMGADSAIQLANQLGEQSIPVSNLITVSPPPDFLTSDITNPNIGSIHNFYTSGQDYLLADDSLLDRVQNIEVADTHTGADENSMVQQFIEQTVVQETTEEIQASETDGTPDDQESYFSDYTSPETWESSQETAPESNASDAESTSSYESGTY